MSSCAPGDTTAVQHLQNGAVLCQVQGHSGALCHACWHAGTARHSILLLWLEGPQSVIKATWTEQAAGVSAHRCAVRHGGLRHQLLHCALPNARRLCTEGTAPTHFHSDPRSERHSCWQVNNTRKLPVRYDAAWGVLAACGKGAHCRAGAATATGRPHCHHHKGLGYIVCVDTTASSAAASAAGEQVSTTKHMQRQS